MTPLMLKTGAKLLTLPFVLRKSEQVNPYTVPSEEKYILRVASAATLRLGEMTK